MNAKVHLDVESNKIKNKNYDLLALAAANLDVYVENGERRISESEFKRRLRQWLKLSNYKAKVLIDTFIELNVFKRDKNDLIILPVNSNDFIKIPIATIRFCLDSLSPFAFKIYCFLKRKYDLHILYKYKENYLFSDKQLLEVCGMSRCTTNLLSLHNVLNTLEELKLISYNHKSHGKPGQQGLYKDLYWVAESCPAQEKAIKDVVEIVAPEINNSLKTIKEKMLIELNQDDVDVWKLGRELEQYKDIDLLVMLDCNAKENLKREIELLC